MMPRITESEVEAATLEWLEGLGYAVLHGSDIAPDEPGAERETYGDVVLVGRLRDALTRLNPDVPADAIEDAVRKLLRTETPHLYENNRRFHRLLTDGVTVEYHDAERIKAEPLTVIDFENPENNDWLAVNQFTVIENQRNRRPDVVIFVNGLPLVVIELKNPADEKATISNAFGQFQTYKHDIPSLFTYNSLLVISDGLEARAGSLTADIERFAPWRTVDGETVAPKGTAELEVLTKGIFQKRNLLDLIQSFTVFEVDGDTITKKIAGYHQFHAVRKAVECTVDATSPDGSKQIGVVWHTQGSGKSLTMVFYAGKIIRHPAMENPTLVVITDRNDLDDQLFDTFSACSHLVRQNPEQAQDRTHLRKLLKVASGGVVFTTIQKFMLAPKQRESFARDKVSMPEQMAAEDKTGYEAARQDRKPLLSDRRNIIVIADEAHRSQYDFIDGFARHMRDALPNASFIGFTGTPIEATDKNTRAVFGDYIDVYDIQRAVEDGATVKIFYEGRLAKITLQENEIPRIDPEFEEITEGEEQGEKQKLRTKWARLEAIVGAPSRLKLTAKDLVTHFEQRLEAMDGKAMIVCMSRRICVDLYQQIVKLRPEWHDEDERKGVIKVNMTGSADDPQHFQPHLLSKKGREHLAKRFKDPEDPLKLVIVRDMWLTGFDVPCLHTMYVDKPMRGHGLMQAIARVNRVFRDKPGGLVVDYIGMAVELKKALTTYTESGGKGDTAIDQSEAVAVMQEKYEVLQAMFHGFDYTLYFTGDTGRRLNMQKAGMEHILAQEDGKKRYIKAVTELSQAFALSVPQEKALKIRDEVGFFQVVRAALVKNTVSGARSPDELDTAIRQIISKAVAADGVVDIFAEAGLKNPDISILSDEFLQEVQDMPHQNLALELLRKLLNDEIKIRSRTNVVLARSFAEMLQQSMRRYQNRSIETAQVIQELIGLAKEMREAHRRGEKLGLSDDEVAFYDALEVNDSAVKVLGDDTLKTIARELVEAVRRNVTIDWTEKESVRAKLRSIVRRLLRKHGYPPDKCEKATRTVLEQAEVLARDWAA